MDLLIYLAKASLLLTLFWVVYKVFLEAEIFHQWKRFYLHLGYAFSLILPLLSVTRYKEINIEASSFTPTTSEFISAETQQTSVELVWSFITEHAVIELLYFGISLLFLAHLMVKFLRLFRFLKASKAFKSEGIFLIEQSIPEGAFSFLNFIVYDPNLYTEDEIKIILNHEKAHITHKHSFDMLLAQCYKCLFWFNPFAWLYQESLALNLEYQADATVLASTAKKEYQMTLYKVIQQQNKPQLQQTFHQSPIKKRIVMLNKNNHNSSLWKLFIISPLLVVFFLLFQVETKAQVKASESTPNTENSKFEKKLEGINEAEKIIINGKEIDKEELVEKYILFDDFQYSEASKTLTITSDSQFSKPYYADRSEFMKELNLSSDKRVLKGLKFFKLSSDYKFSTMKITDVNVSIDQDKPLLSKNISLTNTSDETKNTFLDDNSKYANQNMVMFVDGVKVEKGKTANIDTDQIESVDIIKSPEGLKAEGYNSNFVDGLIKITTKENSSKSKNETNSLSLQTSGDELIYLLDGKEIDKKNLNEINPKDIESVNVIKSTNVIKGLGYDPEEIDGLIEITSKKENDINPSQYLNSNKLQKSALAKNENSIIYKVDGKEVNYKEFAGLDPEQIQSMMVVKSPYDLKEAGYDPKEIDGVIVITTKIKDLKSTDNIKNN